MTDTTTAAADRPETDDLERRRRPWLWIVVGVAVTCAIAFFATQMLGQSVLYYRTPTEVVAGDHTSVRLAGALVPGSVTSDKGTGVTTFQVQDASTKLTVVYTGSTTTALTTAAQPGAQLVAEGSMGTDGVFHSDSLLAKCPSKFQAAADEGKEHPGDQTP